MSEKKDVYKRQLLDFKQPPASGDTVALEGGRDGKADGLIGTEMCIRDRYSAPPQRSQALPHALP